MEYKKYEYPSYNIHAIKTNHFKTIEMRVIFRSEVKKNNLLEKTFLADIMTDCSDKYKTRKEVVRKLEELYQASFYGTTNRIGNVLMTSFVLDFLNPEFVNEEDYLENIIKLPFEMIMNPFIKAKEFDIKNFNVVKRRIHDEILSVSENINQESLKRALNYLETSSPSRLSILGSIEELNMITPKTLASAYEELLMSKCDIFVAGNIDMDIIANHIFKYFKNPVIKTKDYSNYVINNVKKLKKVQEQFKFLETSLVNIYTLENLTEKEKVTTMHFYNYLLGGGGLNTKLYQLLREKNSLCYGIKSMYLKYDNLLVIETSINKTDVKKANSLIKKAFREMHAGKFSDEELKFAKRNFIFSLNLALDELPGIINNYVFHVIDNLPLIDERIKLIEDITKEEIIAISNKIKPAIEFVLEGENDGYN